MPPLPMLLARRNLRVLQVGHEQPMLLVHAETRATMTIDELLRKFADIGRRRDKLRRDRTACQCQRQRPETDGHSPQDGPCWKSLRSFDKDYQMWKLPTETWCSSCRKRQTIHEHLRMVSQQHGAALRGLLRRGYALLDVRQKPTRQLLQAARAK